MKKLFLLFAAMVCGLTANAQSTYTKSSMVVIVTQAKNTFSKDISYKDWIIKQTGSSKTPTAQEEKFLKEVYGFLSSNSNSDLIYKNYDGASLIELAKLKSKGELTVLGSSTTERSWWFSIVLALIDILIDAGAFGYMP
jgi:hypothetical protein